MFRYTILSLALLLLCLPGYGQADSLLLKIKVVDSFSRKALEGVTASVFEQDSATVLLNGMRRRWGEEQVAGSEETVVYPYFEGRVPRRKRYVVKVTHDGYEPSCVALFVPARRHGRTVKEWFPKDILMSKRYSSTGRLLGEATVTASRVVMVMKGDTVEYDARAFRMAEGSMLDNLMAMLPGVTLTEDGRIYVNGKPVRKLMVNGRDFFNGNPQMALNNLPAYTVDKIKAYREGPKWKHLIDEKNTDDSEWPMVVDVSLKREYAQGWLANFEIGGGSKTRNGWDDVYLARLFAMRYTDQSGLALYGNVNNLGDNQSPGRKGEWKKMDVTKGERTVKTGGLSLSIKGKRTGADFTTSVEARREYISSVVTNKSVRHVSGFDVVKPTSTNGEIGQTDLDWKGELLLKTRGTFFQISPYAKYFHNKEEEQRTEEEQWGSLESNASNALEDVYCRELQTWKSGNNWKTGVNIFSKIKSPLSGKNYEIKGAFNYAWSDNGQRQCDKVGNAEAEAGRRVVADFRCDALPQSHYDYSIFVKRYLMETEFFKMGLSYEYAQRYESGKRTREADADTLAVDDEEMEGSTNWLPSSNVDRQWEIDFANSYHTTELQRKHTLSAIFSIQLRNGLRFTTDLFSYFDIRKIRDRRNSMDQSLRKKNASFSIKARVDIRNFQFFYHLYPELPAMLHLLDVRDASDPFAVYRGNASLKKATEHYFLLIYHLRRQKRQRTLYADFNYWLKNDAIGSTLAYDRQTGVYTHQPRNINGNWTWAFNLEYGQALDKQNRLLLSTNTHISQTHSVDFTNNDASDDIMRSVVDNYALSEEISLNYRTTKGIRIGAKGKVAYKKQKAARNSYIDNSSTDYSYGLTLTLPLTKHLGFETDIMAYGRRGYTERSMNTTDWVWNAALSLTLGKQKEWLVRAVGFDLLHQLSSVRREVNAQGYVETRYNTVPAYASLHLIYRLNIKPKKQRP